MRDSSSAGMRNSLGEKSPTVRLATERPALVSARTSLAIFSTSEPVMPRASAERPASETWVRTSRISAHCKCSPPHEHGHGDTPAHANVDQERAGESRIARQRLGELRVEGVVRNLTVRRLASIARRGDDELRLRGGVHRATKIERRIEVPAMELPHRHVAIHALPRVADLRTIELIALAEDGDGGLANGEAIGEGAERRPVPLL